VLDYYGFPAAAVLTSEQTRTLANARAQNTTDGLIEPAHVMNAPQPAADVPVPKLQAVDRGRLLSAALRAKSAYPGPVGELVSRELTTWSELSFRFGGDSTIAKLVDHVMRLPVDDEPLAAA
jgi:hypothetical protein